MAAAIDIYIAELLHEYDCVVVPQLGGFVCNYRPARIDLKQGLAHPPGKDIRFNRNLTKNDGLLVSAYAEGEGWSFAEADEKLKREVEEYWQALNQGKKLDFKKIGLLYFDEEKNLRFEPKTEISFLKNAHGFESFALPDAVLKQAQASEAKVVDLAAERVPAAETTHSQSEKAIAAIEVPLEAKEAKIFEDTPKQIPESWAGATPHLGQNRSIYWVAAACMLPFLLLSLYAGMQTGFKSPGEVQPADLIPFAARQSYQGKYKASAAEITHKQTIGHRATAAFPEGVLLFPFSFSENRIDSTAVWINLAQAEQIKTEKLPVTGKRFHIIGGCFGNKDNALNYLKSMQMKGMGAELLGLHKGLHPVSLAGFANREDALEQLKHWRNDGTSPQGWLLKKETNT